MPNHKVNDLLRSTNNNIEHQGIEVVQDSIMPWSKRFEDEADFKLFGQNRMGLYTKINLRGLLRGDFKSQQEGFEVMRRNGALSADEWRDLVDMNRMPPGEGGEKYIMQANNTTLDKIGADVATAESDAPTQVDEPLPDEQAAQAAIRSMALMLTEAEHVG